MRQPRALPATATLTPTAASPSPTLSGRPTSLVTGVATVALPTPVPASPTPTAVPRTLTLWTTRSDAAWLLALTRAASALSARRPSLSVRLSGGHVDFGQIIENFGTDQAPDVIEPGDLVPFAARSLVRPLDAYLVGGSLSPANYFPAMWSNGGWRGKTYGIPALDHGTELGLIWNTSLTATASAPSSWDELYVFGQRLTQSDASGAIRILGFDPLDGVGGLLDTVRDVTGQEWFDTNTQRVAMASSSYRSFLDSIVSYDNAIGVDRLLVFRQTNRPLTDQRQSAINLGHQVAVLDGYWSVAEIDRFARQHSWQFDYAWVPAIPAGARIQRFGGRVLSIPSLARHPDDAWELVVQLAGDATSRLFCERVGTCAMTRSFLRSGAWKVRPDLAFYVASLDQATRLTGRSNNVVAGFAQEKWTQALSDVLSGRASAADALRSAQTAVQTEVNRVAHV